MFQHFIISFLGGMGFDIILMVMRCIDAHRDFIFFRHLTITMKKLIPDAISPVIMGYIGLAFKMISGNIVFSPYSKHRLIGVCTFIYRIDTGVCPTLCRGTRFIIIVDQVDVHAFAAVSTVPAPVIDNIVSVIDQRTFGDICSATLSKPWVTAVVVCD